MQLLGYVSYQRIYTLIGCSLLNIYVNTTMLQKNVIVRQVFLMEKWILNVRMLKCKVWKSSLNFKGEKIEEHKEMWRRNKKKWVKYNFLNCLRK